ncbi:MAG: nitroreductase family protein [Sporichthyaceae bacterium]
MEFLEAVGSRRSVRWFKTYEPVEREKIQEILEVIRLTTCPGNLQPWRAIVVYRDELDDDIREELLKADNWQGAHVQAPVWIYIFADVEAARPERFAANTQELIECGALPGAYGWSKTRIIDAIERAVETPAGMASIHELLHDLPHEASAAIAYAETVGACSVATLAAVNQGLGTVLHMIARPTSQERVREILGVPDTWVPVWIQLVGYSAEDQKAGGQRPRKPFEELFFEGKVGTPFARDPKVVEKLTEAKLLQAPAPTPGRRDELMFLARMYGYPEDLDD